MHFLLNTSFASIRCLYHSDYTKCFRYSIIPYNNPVDTVVTNVLSILQMREQRHLESHDRASK